MARAPARPSLRLLAGALLWACASAGAVWAQVAPTTAPPERPGALRAAPSTPPTTGVPGAPGAAPRAPPTAAQEPQPRFSPQAPGPLVLPRAPAPPVPATVAQDSEPGEILFFNDDLAGAQAEQPTLEAGGLRLIRRQLLAGIGQVLSTYVARDADAYRRWTTPGPPPPNGVPNHRYGLLSDGSASLAPSKALIDWRANVGVCRQVHAIGVIDTAIDLAHPVLSGARIDAIDLMVPGETAAAPDHGTAVVSVLVGQKPRPGLMPTARLYTVSVFRQRAQQIDSTAELLIRALDLLVQARVKVINISLGGPDNRLLERALGLVQGQGIVVVAAAGNQGPRARPLYPAAYAGVVAVTAVDLLGRAYPQANRGEHLTFAAPGVDIPVAAPRGRVVYQSGTSLAAPFVTAALAAGASLEALTAATVDLGDAGRDPVFGWGLLQMAAGCARRV